MRHTDKVLIVLRDDMTVLAGKCFECAQALVVAYEDIWVVDCHRSQCDEPSVEITGNLTVRLILCLSYLAWTHLPDEIENSVKVDERELERALRIVSPSTVVILIGIVYRCHIDVEHEELVGEL